MNAIRVLVNAKRLARSYLLPLWRARSEYSSTSLVTAITNYSIVYVFVIPSSYCHQNVNATVWLAMTAKTQDFGSIEALLSLQHRYRNLRLAHLDIELVLRDTPALKIYKSKDFWNTSKELDAWHPAITMCFWTRDSLI